MSTPGTIAETITFSDAIEKFMYMSQYRQKVCSTEYQYKIGSGKLITYCQGAAIQGAGPHLEVKPECALGEWMEDCPDGMQLFRPDAFILDHKRRLLVVWEFTRGMAEQDEEFRRREEDKSNAYHGVRLFLRSRMKGYQVVQQTFVMGILTSTRQREFERQLTELGLGKDTLEGIGRAAAVAAIRANGYVLSKRMERLQGIGEG
jgi:hypothetical protein